MSATNLKLLEVLAVVDSILYLILLIVKCYFVSIVAQVWVFKLTQPDNIFYFVRKWLWRLADWYSIDKEGNTNTAKYQRAAYLLKPVIDCEHCVTGQIALWFSICYGYGHSILYYIVFISTSIFITQLHRKSWQ